VNFNSHSSKSVMGVLSAVATGLTVRFRSNPGNCPWPAPPLTRPHGRPSLLVTYDSLLSRVDHEPNQGYRQLTQKEQPWQIDS